MDPFLKVMNYEHIKIEPIYGIKKCPLKLII